MKKHNFRLSALIIGAALAQQAMASGYHFGTQSISAQGTGNASGAEAADATTLFYNPAGMSYLTGNELSGVLAIVDPNVKFTDTGSTTVLGTPTGGDNGGKIASPTAVPHFYLTHQVDDRLSLGLAVFVPFGDAISYDNNWTGRYNIDQTKLETININPAFSLKVTDTFRIGGGISAQYMKAILGKTADFGTGAASLIQSQLQSGAIPAAAAPVLSPVLATMPGNQAYDGNVYVDGTGWGFGWNIGMMWDISKDSRIGFAYRSAIHENLTGTASWYIPSSFNSVPVVGSSIAPTLQVQGFISSGASVKATTPESASVSWFSQLDPVWGMMASVTWTAHSRLQNIDIKFDSGLPDSFTPENWTDTFAAAAGATYRVSPTLLLRGGLTYDESPVSDDNRTPSIPDGKRRTIAFGGNYAFDKSNSLDFVAAYTAIGTLNISQYDNGGVTSATGQQICNQALNTSSCSTLNGQYKINAWTFGAQYNYKF